MVLGKERRVGEVWKRVEGGHAYKYPVGPGAQGDQAFGATRSKPIDEG